MDFRADGVMAAANTDSAAASTSLAAAEAEVNPPADTTGVTTGKKSSLTAPKQSMPPAEALTDPNPDGFHIRAPLSHRKSPATGSTTAAAYKTPNIQWMGGTWHVTHTSLPLWKDKRNTRITYSELPDNKIDDLVRYQMQDSTKVKSIEGVDTPNPDAEHDGGGAWKWRGKGWLRIASSDWEILGWGETPEGEQWAVTYFAKTLFTPPGIDVYARKGQGLSDTTFQEVEKSLVRLGEEHADLKKLVDDLYSIQRDDAMDKP